MNYWERLGIAADQFAQAISNKGTFGVTISARAGTAMAHGHAWGCKSFAALDSCWPFGKDQETGESHCVGAIKNDALRAVAAIRELLGDEVVVSAFDLEPFKAQLWAELCVILKPA